MLLLVLEGVLEALGPHRTHRAESTRGLRRSTTIGEEHCIRLPNRELGTFGFDLPVDRGERDHVAKRASARPAGGGFESSLACEDFHRTFLSPLGASLGAGNKIAEWGLPRYLAHGSIPSALEPVSVATEINEGWRRKLLADSRNWSYREVDTMSRPRSFLS